MKHAADDRASMAALAEFVNSAEQSESQLLRRIESLDVSADVKALLSDLLRMASRIGDQLLRVGRKIVEFVLALVRQFPMLSFGVLIAFVLSALLASVPVLGAVLGPVLTPLALALGVVWGAGQEVQAGDLAERVREFVGNFSSLAA